MKNYVKFTLKTYFFKIFSLLLIFFIDTIMSVISSTQIACDAMCVQCVQKQPPEVLFKKGVLKNFANFTGKHLCWSLFFNKVANPQAPTQMCSCEISKILRTPILKNICGRLLIK